MMACKMGITAAKPASPDREIHNHNYDENTRDEEGDLSTSKIRANNGDRQPRVQLHHGVATWSVGSLVTWVVQGEENSAIEFRVAL